MTIWSFQHQSKRILYEEILQLSTFLLSSEHYDICFPDAVTFQDVRRQIEPGNDPVGQLVHAAVERHVHGHLDPVKRWEFVTESFLTSFTRIVDNVHPRK